MSENNRVPRFEHSVGYCLLGDLLTIERNFPMHGETHDAIVGWLEAHGIDSRHVPLGTTVQRKPVEQEIIYTRYVTDMAGKVVPEIGPDGRVGAQKEEVTHPCVEPVLEWPPLLVECPRMFPPRASKDSQ